MSTTERAALVDEARIEAAANRLNASLYEGRRKHAWARECRRNAGLFDRLADALSAADAEIAARDAKLARAVEVVEPFARIMQRAGEPLPGIDDTDMPVPFAYITFGHLRAAAAFHADMTKGDEG